MKQKVRVRFAPSPTGPLHIGGVRTALFNYLFAKKHKGAFILRIEDTDQNRFVEGSEQYILEALSWCGLEFDEGPHIKGPFGPYRQSERKEIYREYAEALVASNNAYYAFDTPESLDRLRKEKESDGATFIYNWTNRESLSNSLVLPPEVTQDKITAGEDFVIRFKSPRDQTLLLQDQIRGAIEIDSNTLDDKVLFKSDGMPTYHLANIVDDHLMQITHVIRGEEWLPSLALHAQLYNAFGWEAPVFAHLPLIMKPEGKGKLSKRDGEKLGFPVYPLSWQQSKGYRESGYFPEAVINFLALLGWNPGTEQELFNLEQLVESFSLDRVHRSGARFNPEKTKWYNHQYLQSKNNRELAELLLPIIETNLEATVDQRGATIGLPDLAYVEKTIGLLKDRASFVYELWESGDYFYLPPKEFNQKVVSKHWKADTRDLLSRLLELLHTAELYDSKYLEELVKAWIGDHGISFGKLMPPLRLALVGDLKGPHIFDIMELLGRENTTGRIKYAMEQLG